MWASISALIAGQLLKLFTFETIKYVAFRAFLIALFLGLGPVVMLKGFTMILKIMMEYTVTMVSGMEIEPIVLNITGMGGWIVSKLRVAEALSIYLSFCLLSMSLRMIRVK